MGVQSGGSNLPLVQGSSPAIGLLSSRGADDAVLGKGFVSISQLLAPYCGLNISIRDPSTGMPVSSRITLDIRDLRKDGHLLSLTVLPHVLQEALLFCTSSLDTNIGHFVDTLSQWMEPVEQETFRSYIACLFFVSTRDENPLAELSQLIQAQHAQQHSSSDASSLGPSHCSRPLWTTPNTLKHYVLIVEAHDEQRGRDIISQMRTTYGSETCSQIRLEGAVSPVENDGLSLPDAWAGRLTSSRILEQGLTRARNNLMEKANMQREEKNGSGMSTPSTPGMGITTISSSYSISSAASASPSAPIPPPLPPPPKVGRRSASQQDRDQCTQLLEQFTKNNLIPFVERQLRTMNEQLSNKRGISRSLTTGMRKWFTGSGSGNSNGSAGAAAPITYSWEAQEMQLRRLADIAFLFGLYLFAHSQYQAAKKEFAADQAWLHHAMSLELSAISLHLAQPQLTSKQFPTHYIDNALNGLIQTSARWSSQLRAGLNAWRIFTHLEMHIDAAGQLIRLTSIENDACVGVCLWLAASSFEKAKMYRKAAFYRFLAGHRFSKGGLSSLSLLAFTAAYPEYAGKQWTLAEDALSLELSSFSSDGRLAVEAATRLLLPPMNGRQRQNENTARHLANYGRTRSRLASASCAMEATRSVPVPQVNESSTRVVCGERPMEAKEEYEDRGEEWSELQRAAFHTVAGTSSAFHPLHIVNDGGTDNQRVRETPPGERFRVQLRVSNPLSIPITMRDVHLGVEHVKLRDGEEGNESSMDAMHKLDSVTLQAEEKGRLLELWLVPGHSVAEFRVCSLRFVLLCSPDGLVVPGEIPLHIKGRRLNKTHKQMTSVVYAVDERLRATVGHKRWPTVDVSVLKAPPTVLYTDQLIQIPLEVRNVGHDPLHGMAVSTDAVDSAVVFEDEEGGRKEMEGLSVHGSPHIRSFPLKKGGTLDVGEKTTVVVEVRAPSTVTPSHTISILILYRSPEGVIREWRTMIRLPVVQLLQTSSRVLDAYHGLVSLSLRNSVDSHCVALARVECTRVRCAVASRMKKRVLLLEERGVVAVHAVGERQVKLESGQEEELCVRIGAVEEMKEVEWEMEGNERTGSLPPEWPLPIHMEGDDLSDGHDSSKDSKKPPIRRLVVAVAWKASIVSNDGMVSSLTGESFLSDPFAAAGLAVPGLQLGSSLSSPGGVASPLPPASEEEAESRPAVYVSALPVQPIEHDFEKMRMCEFPLTMIVRNEDANGRSAKVEMKFKPKVRDHTGPPPRQQWWLSRESIHVECPPRTTRHVKTTVRVTQASAYDLLGPQMSCTVLFEGDSRPRPLRIPPTLAVVYSIYGG